MVISDAHSIHSFPAISTYSSNVKLVHFTLIYVHGRTVTIFPVCAKGVYIVTVEGQIPYATEVTQSG